MKTTDVDLIHRILDGDDTAFTELVEKYRKPIHALVWRKIGDFHIAEEITQDTFLKAYQELKTLKKPHSFASWLYVIASNKCSTWLRKKRPMPESFEDTNSTQLEKLTYSGYVISEKERIAIESQREAVEKLLAKLQESERTVITLYYFGEMSSAEIGAFLGVSANTVRSRLRRAQQRLKKEETMIREALEHFQISPNLTDNIMTEISRLKPTPSGSKPLIPWAVAASTAVFIALMLGIGNQHLARFQKPYSLDVRTGRTVEIVNAQIVQNVDVKPKVRNQVGTQADTGDRDNGNGQGSNQVLGDKGDYTRWNLPDGAKARLSKGRIYGISYSPDATQIAVGSATGVWIYDARMGAELALLTDHTSRTGKVVFSPDGKTLATGLTNKILLWHTATGKLLKTLKKENGAIRTLRIIDDGKTLRSDYYDGTVRLWDIATGDKKDFHPTPPSGLRGIPRYIRGQEVRAADLYLSNVDNKGIFAVGDVFGNIRLEDAITGQHLKTLQEHKDRIRQLVFSPDGTHLVSNDYSNDPPRLWDVTTGKMLKPLTTDGFRTASGLIFSKDGKTLACRLWDWRIGLWDVATKTHRTTLNDKDGAIAIREMAFSPDSKTVAGTVLNGDIQVWNVNTGEELSSFSTEHTQGVTALAFSLDSSTLASVQEGKIRVWDTFNGTQLSDRIDNDTGLDALVLSPNGRTVIGIEGFKFMVEGNFKTYIESILGKLTVWDTHTGKKLSELPVESHKEPEFPGQKYNVSTHTATDGIAAFSKNGVMLASVLNSRHASMVTRFTIDLWAAPYRKSHTNLKGHTDTIRTLAFTPNGNMIASGSDDGTIRLWDTGTGTQMLNIPSSKTYTLAFSMDGKILASSDLVNIQLWDVDTGTQLTSLKGHSDSATVLAFSTDSKIFASGSRDGTIRLWDISTDNEVTTFKGHVDRVNILSFSPDGKILASGSVDGAIFLWGISN